MLCKRQATKKPSKYTTSGDLVFSNDIYTKKLEAILKIKIIKIDKILASGLFFNKKFSEFIGITLVNSGIRDKFPFTR